MSESVIRVEDDGGSEYFGAGEGDYPKDFKSPTNEDYSSSA